MTMTAIETVDFSGHRGVDDPLESVRKVSDAVLEVGEAGIFRRDANVDASCDVCFVLGDLGADTLGVTSPGGPGWLASPTRTAA